MELIGILALVFLLYFRTLSYNYVIDDNVKREGYLFDVPETAPSPDFFNTRPSKLYRLFMIGMHCVNVSVIYMLWGWGPALIFAVHPMSVWGVAWVTGNYYATAAYFTLIAYFFLHTFNAAWAVLPAMALFTAALNSTVCPINFPFFLALTGHWWGLTMFAPLAAFLFGKRFQTGIKIRLGFHVNKKLVDTTPYLTRLVLMTKVVARYTYDAIVPNKIGFFGPMGQNLRDEQAVYDKMHAINKDFWASFAVILSVLALGLIVSPEGVLWFFTFIALHSQWNLTGQFYAQRYLYLPLVGLCTVAGTLLQPHPIAMIAVVTFLVLRTYLYIPAWRNQGCVLRNDIENYPENGQVYNNYAQYIMASGKNLDNIKLNELAMNLFRAEKMDPKAWEVQMNIAAFFATVGHWKEAYTRTLRSIELLEPLGGIARPLDSLKAQKANIERILAAKAAEEQKKAEADLLGSSLSRPPAEIGSTTQKEERHDTRTEEGPDGKILEPVGSSVA